MIKYDFNKQEFCKGLTAAKLMKYGFTNHEKSTWYRCWAVSRDGSDITFNVSIKLGNMKESEIDILDEDFCQPYTPVVHYYLGKKEYDELNDYQKFCVNNCDRIIRGLISHSIIYFRR